MGKRRVKAVSPSVRVSTEFNRSRKASASLSDSVSHGPGTSGMGVDRPPLFGQTAPHSPIFASRL